jgi:hypothetical protein
MSGACKARPSACPLGCRSTNSGCSSEQLPRPAAHAACALPSESVVLHQRGGVRARAQLRGSPHRAMQDAAAIGDLTHAITYPVAMSPLLSGRLPPSAELNHPPHPVNV